MAGAEGPARGAETQPARQRAGAAVPVRRGRGGVLDVGAGAVHDDRGPRQGRVQRGEPHEEAQNADERRGGLQRRRASARRDGASADRRRTSGKRDDRRAHRAGGQAVRRPQGSRQRAPSEAG